MLRKPPAHLPIQTTRPAFLTFFGQVLSDIRSIVVLFLGALRLAGTTCGTVCSRKGQAFGLGPGAQGKPVDSPSLLVICLAAEILRPLAPQTVCPATLRIPIQSRGLLTGSLPDTTPLIQGLQASLPPEAHTGNSFSLDH